MSPVEPKLTFRGYAVTQEFTEKKWILYPIAREQDIIAVVTEPVTQAEDVKNYFVKFSDDPVSNTKGPKK